MLEKQIEAKMQEPWLNEKQTQWLEELARTDEDLQQLRRHLAMLEKLEGAAFATIGAVQVRILVQQSVLSLQLPLEDRRLAVQFDLGDDAPLRANQRLFESLTGYLLRLALSHAQPAATLQVGYREAKLTVQVSPTIVRAEPDPAPFSFEEVLARAICNYWRLKATFVHEGGRYTAAVDCTPLTEAR